MKAGQGDSCFGLRAEIGVPLDGAETGPGHSKPLLYLLGLGVSLCWAGGTPRALGSPLAGWQQALA